jgi:hypothetical protein
MKISLLINLLFGKWNLISCVLINKAESASEKNLKREEKIILFIFMMITFRDELNWNVSGINKYFVNKLF